MKISNLLIEKVVGNTVRRFLNEMNVEYGDLKGLRLTVNLFSPSGIPDGCGPIGFSDMTYCVTSDGKILLKNYNKYQILRMSLDVYNRMMRSGETVKAELCYVREEGRIEKQPYIALVSRKESMFNEGTKRVLREYELDDDDYPNYPSGPLTVKEYNTIKSILENLIKNVEAIGIPSEELRDCLESDNGMVLNAINGILAELRGAEVFGGEFYDYVKKCYIKCRNILIPYEGMPPRKFALGRDEI